MTPSILDDQPASTRMTRQLSLDTDKSPDKITWTATCSRGQDKACPFHLSLADVDGADLESAM